MLNSLLKKVVIIGCGNVAWHLAEKLSRHKKFELFVYNHKANKGLALFKSEFGASVSASIKDIIDADVYFICVNDAAIGSVISNLSYLPLRSKILITSGNFDYLSVKTRLKNLSIFYPLQTFTKTDDVKWKDMTFIIDPANKLAEQKAREYAGYFTKNILQLNYQQRIKLHLSAVFVNNFTNCLYVEADKMLRSIGKDLDYKLLLPLIKQGTKKLKHISPLEAQTGPAKRNDTEVMQKHLALLKNNKNLKELYQLLSNLIIKQQKHA